MQDENAVYESKGKGIIPSNFLPLASMFPKIDMPSTPNEVRYCAVSIAAHYLADHPSQSIHLLKAAKAIEEYINSGTQPEQGF